MLLSYSGSHSLTSLMEIGIAIIIVLIWLITYLFRLSQELQFYIVLVAAMLLVWGSYAYLSFQDKRNSNTAYHIRRRLSKMRQGDKEWWSRLQHFIDTPHLPEKEVSEGEEEI